MTEENFHKVLEETHTDIKKFGENKDIYISQINDNIPVAALESGYIKSFQFNIEKNDIIILNNYSSNKYYHATIIKDKNRFVYLIRQEIINEYFISYRKYKLRKLLSQNIV